MYMYMYMYRLSVYNHASGRHSVGGQSAYGTCGPDNNNDNQHNNKDSSTTTTTTTTTATTTTTTDNNDNHMNNNIRVRDLRRRRGGVRVRQRLLVLLR